MPVEYVTSPTMNVGELIALLKEQPTDALVYTEGCDCEGAVGTVSFTPESVSPRGKPRRSYPAYVLIERPQR